MTLLTLLVGCGLFGAGDEDEGENLTPRERLEQALPGLGDAAAGVFGEEERDLAPLADLVREADPDLVRLLLPKKVRGAMPDTVGEVLHQRARLKASAEDLPEVDLLEAEATLRGGVLRARIVGTGVAEGGAALELDTRGGPAPDLLVRVPTADTITVATLDNWVEGPAQAFPGQVTLTEDTVSLTVDLSETGRLESGHAGAAGARIEAGEGAAHIVDRGPAGRLGRPSPHALSLLKAMLATKGVDLTDDPDLALAVAIGFAPWRGWVAIEVRPEVAEDAADWFRYGLGLDAWLEREGAAWRLGTLPGEAKLLWAWPGAQSVSYGAFAVAREDKALSLARYRFLVPDVATLEAWRDALPMGEDVLSTAELRDTALWDDLRYRATPAAMDAVCEDGRVRSNMCAGWARDVAQGKDLGWVDGVRVGLDQGVSASHQLRVRERERELVGDCATATTVSIAAMQAVGVPALPVGYEGDDWSTPTHVQPAVLLGERFLSPQDYPSAKWSSAPAWVYVAVPALDPSMAAALGEEPGGGARGPAVAAGRTTYGALSMWGEAGVPLDTVMGWVRDGMNGEWGSSGGEASPPIQLPHQPEHLDVEPHQRDEQPEARHPLALLRRAARGAVLDEVEVQHEVHRSDADGEERDPDAEEPALVDVGHVHPEHAQYEREQVEQREAARRRRHAQPEVLRHRDEAHPVDGQQRERRPEGAEHGRHDGPGRPHLGAVADPAQERALRERVERRGDEGEPPCEARHEAKNEPGDGAGHPERRADGVRGGPRRHGAAEHEEEQHQGLVRDALDRHREGAALHAGERTVV